MYPTGGVGSARLGGGANSGGRSSGRSSDILSIWLAGAIRTSLYRNAPSAGPTSRRANSTSRQADCQAARQLHENGPGDHQERRAEGGAFQRRRPSCASSSTQWSPIPSSFSLFPERECPVSRLAFNPNLTCDSSPEMEPFPAPRATRFLLLQKGQLMRSDLTVLNAQMFNHSLHAHMVRDRLHLGQLNISLEPLNLVSVRAYPRRDCHDGRGGVLFAAAKFLLSQAIASAQQSRRAREIEEAAQWMMGTIVFCPDK